MDEISFLQLCRKSSQDTYEAYKWLLSQLEDPLTRSNALGFWHSLTEKLKEKHHPSEMMSLYHFSLLSLAFRQEESRAIELNLLQLPSTFAPEDWSFTFFEGLARYKPTEFQDKIIAELGCGIGWITLALAKEAKVGKIYGLDINPKAILCSRINLYINTFNHQGAPLWQHEGRTLLDVVEFHQSDLLKYCRSREIFLDRVIGCIPQVLNPDPEFASRVKARRGLEQALEVANDEFLQSLSNYTGDQGYIEDQFGLGLIARAAEESADVLRIAGKIILNLGGRPGSGVLQRLFLRRGFAVHPVWRTRVSQAKDTDIRSLVSIEEKTSHRFEFYMGQGSDTPVSAKTALAYAEAGGEIGHGLSVYEAQLRDTHLPKILQFMRQPGYEEARNAIDLSYSEDALAVEKISYLDALTEQLKAGSSFPYEETLGLKQFRERIATYFDKYFKIPLEEDNFLITPSRATACQNILNTLKPNQVLIDSQLANTLEYRPEILETPRSSELLCDLIEKLHPQIVIYSMPPHEALSRDSFLRICYTAEKWSCRVFIDISDLIELSSTPSNNGIFRHLVKHNLPPHVSLLCGLVKNRLYHDLEVCFLISENQDLLKNLENSAELTYSRTPTLSQLYYDRILQELINFQIMETRGNISNRHLKRNPAPEHPSFKKKYVQVSSNAENAFAHPAIQAESFARAPDLIRLDYGENRLSSPRLLHRTIFEAFSKMQISPEESDCTQEVVEVARNRFSFKQNGRAQVIYSCGVAPLFSKIADNCTRSNAALVFPGGTYGHFIASAQYYGARVIKVPTMKENHFKLSPEELEKALCSTENGAWVFLNAPLVNPTGALYSVQELEKLLAIVEKYRATVILDTIFSGLEFDEPSKSLVDLSQFDSLKWIILGGISKEFAAGGLRIGYGVSTDPIAHADLSHGQLLPSPHRTLKFALKKVYQHLLRGNPELLADLYRQRGELKRRTQEITEVLRKTGWDPLPSFGGLFLCATPTDSKQLQYLEDAVLKKAKVVINPPSWTEIPGYFRFVLSTSSQEFTEALQRLGSLANHP